MRDRIKSEWRHGAVRSPERRHDMRYWGFVAMTVASKKAMFGQMHESY